MWLFVVLRLSSCNDVEEDAEALHSKVELKSGIYHCGSGVSHVNVQLRIRRFLCKGSVLILSFVALCPRAVAQVCLVSACYLMFGLCTGSLVRV